jgi:hypothetical protein
LKKTLYVEVQHIDVPLMTSSAVPDWKAAARSIKIQTVQYLSSRSQNGISNPMSFTNSLDIEKSTVVTEYGSIFSGLNLLTT